MKHESQGDAPLLSRLFTGELDEHQLGRLLERAETEPELSAELDLVADLTAAAELARDELEPLVPAPAPHTTRRWPPLVAAAAAAAAGLALTFWLARPPVFDAAELGAAAPPPFFPAELRDAAGPLPVAFAEAMEPYVAADWAGAEASLDRFLERHAEHGPAHFYRGVARVELGRLAAAAGDFAFVARTQTGYLGEHARWRGALARLLQDDVEGARAELRLLLDAEGSFAPNAEALLERTGGR